MFQNLFSFGRQSSPFEDFLRKHGKETEIELVDGTPVEGIPQHIEAEKLRVWLQWLLAEYLQQTQIGVLVDATIPIAINTRRARRASLAYINNSCRDIIRNNAVYGAPDLVIDIVSPSALSTALNAREADYRALEVPEIVFLDPVRRSARVLRLRGREYEEETLNEMGTLHLAMLDGIALPMSALMREPRPAVQEMVAKLL
ncbi:MAG: Uma2 family endonuclease [Armatimonadaceae bacterium]